MNWWQEFIEYCLIRLELHFLLGLAVGLLVFSLTSTILSLGCWGLKKGDSSIPIISLLLALSLSVVVHMWEDYFIRWF